MKNEIIDIFHAIHECNGLCSLDIHAGSFMGAVQYNTSAIPMLTTNGKLAYTNDDSSVVIRIGDRTKL